jgi:Helicase associated domain
MLAHSDKWSYTVFGVIWLLCYVPAFGWMSTQWVTLPFHHCMIRTKFLATRRASKRSLDVISSNKTTSIPSRRVEMYDNTWEETYQRLLEYQQEHGHTNVPRSYNDDNKRPLLGEWVTNQRFHKKKQSLSQYRVNMLESIGFQWQLDSQDRRQQMRDERKWDVVFKRLELYQRQHGHVNVPKEYNDGKKPHLGQWVSLQRFQFWIHRDTDGDASSLTAERISKLESLGFVWILGNQPAYDASWESNFQALVAFKSKYNTTKIPMGSKGHQDPINQLATWTKNQRLNYNKFLTSRTLFLTDQRFDLLNSIDFAWSLKNKTVHETWMYSYFELYWHYHKHNNTQITLSSGYNTAFVNWVSRQKKMYHAGKLDQGKIDLLNELDFDWEMDTSATWEELFEELSLYKENFASTLVNKNINHDLGVWTAELRKLYAASELDTKWVAKLNSLGFHWNAVDVDWNAMCDRLASYKRKHNSACVPYSCAEDPPLGKWVHYLRPCYKKFQLQNVTLDESMISDVAQGLASKKVSADTHAARLGRLLEVGFVWDAWEAQWMMMYERLVKYKAKHNSALIPDSYELDPELAAWIGTQRCLEAGMSERRKRLLDAIGFVWDPQEHRWLEMFERFCKYNKYELDNTKFDPHGYKADPDLARWVDAQRWAFRIKRMSTERIQLLDSVGFVWKKLKESD